MLLKAAQNKAAQKYLTKNPHVRKSICRFFMTPLMILCMINKKINVTFVLCRRLAYGWYQHSRKWSQRDDHAEVVHSTNQQHRWAESRLSSFKHYPGVTKKKVVKI